MANQKNQVLVTGACVFKDVRGRQTWFLVKQGEEDDWEIPKALVRRGESSVRAALRMMSEKGGMTVRVLEEAGRSGGVTTINGRTLPQRHIYYLMVAKSAAEEPIGFSHYAWLEYGKAARKISSKKERQIFKAAKETLAKLRKEELKRKRRLS